MEATEKVGSYEAQCEQGGRSVVLYFWNFSVLIDNEFLEEGPGGGFRRLSTPVDSGGRQISYHYGRAARCRGINSCPITRETKN